MKCIVLIAVLSAWSAAAAADPTLIGQWISDRDASVAYNEEHVRLQPKTAEFLKESMGRLVITFRPGKVSYELPDFTSSIEGKEFPVTGYSESHPYAVVATTPSAIAIRTIEPVSHEPAIVVYNFVASDRMWVYVSTSGSHVREYFKRVSR